MVDPLALIKALIVFIGIVMITVIVCYAAHSCVTVMTAEAVAAIHDEEARRVLETVRREYSTFFVVVTSPDGTRDLGVVCNTH